MLEDAVADAARSNVQHGLLLLEPDHYQRLLHEIGLDAADTMLAAIAERPKEAIGGDAIAARFSEHTLAVLMRGSDYAQTTALPERTRQAFASHVFQNGTRHRVTPRRIGGVKTGEELASVSHSLA